MGVSIRLALVVFIAHAAQAQQSFITVASTTSTGGASETSSSSTASCGTTSASVLERRGRLEDSCATIKVAMFSVSIAALLRSDDTGRRHTGRIARLRLDIGHCLDNAPEAQIANLLTF